MKTKKNSDSTGKTSMGMGLALVAIGIFLVFYNEFLKSEPASQAVGLISMGFGTAFFFLGLEKNINIKTSYIGVGSLLITIWSIGLLWLDSVVYNIFGLLFLFVGLSGIFMGIVEIIDARSKKGETTKEPLLKVLILYLTGISSFVLTIAQIFNSLQ